MLSTLRAILGRIFFRKRSYAIYELPTDHAFAAESDPEAYSFDAEHPPNEAEHGALRRVSGPLGRFIMFRRMKRDGAVCLVLFDTHGEVRAYGWLQRWKSQRFEFGWLADDAICLGPFWTRPDQRGQGLYGRLLSHGVYECRRRFDLPVFIWAEPSNAPSRRGIEKAGFAFVGEFSVFAALGHTIRRHWRI